MAVTMKPKLSLAAACVPETRHKQDARNKFSTPMVTPRTQIKASAIVGRYHDGNHYRQLRRRVTERVKQYYIPALTPAWREENFSVNGCHVGNVIVDCCYGATAAPQQTAAFCPNGDANMQRKRKLSSVAIATLLSVHFLCA